MRSIPMNGADIQLRDTDHASVTGELTFSTAPALLERSVSLKSASGKLIVDLQGVTRADSAGLALLVEWLRLARASGRDIHYVNLPDQLLRVVRVSGLEQLFAVK